jgi:GNAT superfamily N-acetyltransferase
MSGLTIRAALPSDREVLLEQFQGLNLFEDAITGDRAIDRVGAETSLAYSEQRIAKSGGHMLVAEMDGVVIGHLFLIFALQGPFVHPDRRPHGYVSELFVRQAVRGGGIGRALLAEAERLTRAHGLDRMLIGVVAGNDRAEQTYLRAGFAPYSRELLKKLD